MSAIAFYAPLKSPEHQTPSGDRELARGLRAALAQNRQHRRVELVSRFRCYDGLGDSNAQQQLQQQARQEITRLLAEPASSGWSVWVTYHNYYKAPDLLGPVISRTLNIPYLLIEASIAPERRSGPWSTFAQLADAACAQADVILYLTQRDKPQLLRHQQKHQRIAHLRPFLNRRTLPPRSTGYEDAEHNGTPHELLAVGMFRYGDKLDSYRVLAETMSLWSNDPVQLVIVGDGPARQDIEALFRQTRVPVRFYGQLGEQDLARRYHHASVLIWPGVNEAFGMTYLEAQAAGLPVVAQQRPGVRDVIAPGQELASVGDPAELAMLLQRVLKDREYRQQRIAEARQFIRQGHLLDAASTTLDNEIQSVLST